MVSLASINAGDSTPKIIPLHVLRPTLLVVDDEEGPRQSLRVVFKDEFNVLLASDGMAAIEMARNARIDVAVLDIRMGGMSGIELLEKLKQVDPAIEVVMMTAFETTETIRQALRLSACDYINKPFDLGTMREAVAKAMQRRSLTVEVKENAEKLEALRAELEEQKLEQELAQARGEIYASIIHDINSPLTVISGLIQMMNERMGDQSEIAGQELEQFKDRLKRITRQVTACIEISRRYLSLMRRNAPDGSRVLVDEVLVDLEDLLRAHPSVRNNQLVVEPLRQQVFVNTNGTDLIQIILNLATNALKCSSKPHRVRIASQLIEAPLDLDQLQDGPNDRFINGSGLVNSAPLLSLSVEDDGPGIPADLMPKIFEPYFTTQPHSGGTGLGLCIVHRLLKQSSGGLHVRSKPGQGSVFTVYLPARPATGAFEGEKG
jgi:two-component system, sensor histidine kinase and response regulator